MTERMDVIERLILELRHDACNDEMPELSEQLSYILVPLAELRAEVAAQQHAAIERDACIKAVQMVVDGEDTDLIGGKIGEPLRKMQAEIAALRQSIIERDAWITEAMRRLAAAGNAQEQEAKWNRTTKATGDLVE
jgi:prefoldin subunit 5